MLGLQSRVLGLIVGLAGGAFALTYDVNDCYDRTKYTCTVLAVGEISNLPNIQGTHYPVLKPAQMAAFAKYNRIMTNVINIYLGGVGSPVATGYLFKGTGDSDPWNKVVVMADGYDYGNKRRIDSIACYPAYNNLVEPSTAVGSKYSPLANGCDVMFVDFADGAADIRKNAKAYLKLLEEVNARATGYVTAGGFSMGGLVSRLALLYGQKTLNGIACGDISKVKKYLAVDSPMQGAGGIPLSLQELIRDKAGSDPWNRLNCDAVQQMLFVHTSAGGTAEHDKFYGFLASQGNYPKGIDAYSFANADWTAPYPASSYAYTINVNVTFAVYAWVPDPSWLNILGVPTVEWKRIWSNSKSGTYKTITFSGKDLEAGSASGIIADVEANAKPLFNATTMAGELVAWGVINPAIFGLSSAFLAGTGGIVVDGASISSSYPAGFKPTFMPISSVFDLSSSTPAGMKNAASLQALSAQGYTPFTGLYLSSARYQHIAFNQEFCANIVNALGKSVDRLIPARMLLLN